MYDPLPRVDGKTDGLLWAVKSFSSAEDAQLFLAGKDPSLDPTSSSYTAKFYGVRSGRVPGVYTDWASAEAQVKGVTKPKVKYVTSNCLRLSKQGEKKKN